MTYCGMFEYENRDGTTIWIHEWVQVTEIKLFGLKFETYCFGMYRKCLPLLKEII